MLFFYAFYIKQYKNTQVNNYKPGLISKNDRLHELQCKLKERQAENEHKDNNIIYIFMF